MGHGLSGRRDRRTLAGRSSVYGFYFAFSAMFIAILAGSLPVLL
ncbi:hypothetical protein [Candidatus Accumulibacter aalborgensis]|nr:hypothetical protein [Candidatus Accumulibacter aalborgensis]